ncbi:MAG: class I SAM-dependent methyltransferase, partial [Myxococcota bacterium]
PKGQVLCLGEGEGRNAVWLAARGMEVTAVDYSDAALERARRLAKRHNVDISTVHADLAVYKFPESAYDAVVSIFVHMPEPLRRVVHHNAVRALRPGGFLIAEYFSREQLGFGTGGPKNPDMLYTVEGLRRDFEGAEIEQLEQVETELEEGRYHQGRASVIRVVVSRTG